MCYIICWQSERSRENVFFSLSCIFIKLLRKKDWSNEIDAVWKEFWSVARWLHKKCCNGIDAAQKEFAKLTCYITCILYPTHAFGLSVGQRQIFFTKSNVPLNVLPLGWCTWYLGWCIWYLGLCLWCIFGIVCLVFAFFGILHVTLFMIWYDITCICCDNEFGAG